MRFRVVPAFLALFVAAALAEGAFAQEPSPAGQDPAAPAYDIIAADRDIAWRINRVTGEVAMCRSDTVSVDMPKAICTVATLPDGRATGAPSADTAAGGNGEKGGAAP